MKLSDISAMYEEQPLEPTATMTQTVEREYSYFAHVNVAELVETFRKDPAITSQVFLEGGLTHDKELGKIRLRHYPNDKTQSSTKLERKVRISEFESTEETVELPEGFLKPLVGICTSLTSRIRFFVPATTPTGKAIKYSDGTLLVWQVDVFMDTLNPDDVLETSTLSDWIKIELEVRDIVMTSEQVQEAIPFECKQIIDARSKDESERQLIDTLYTKVYNLTGKPMEARQPAPAETGNVVDTTVDNGSDNFDFGDPDSKPAKDDDFDFNGGGNKPAEEPKAPEDKPDTSDDNNDDFDFDGSSDKPAEQPAQQEPAEPEQPAQASSSDDEFNFGG